MWLRKEKEGVERLAKNCLMDKSKGRWSREGRKGAP